MIKRTLNHFCLIFVVILILLFLSPPPTSLGNSCADVAVSEAKTMIDSNPSLVVLDVRNHSEYDSGHIRHAKLIPVYELESRLGELDLNDEILVYCRSGVRSSTASQVLSDNGFSHIYNMLGGISAWIDEGYPAYVKYSSIQEAIINATSGDTIFVSSGKYNEHVVVRMPCISLVGEDPESTLIYGNGTQPVLYMNTYSANVTGFTIQNGTEGLHLPRFARACAIRDCRIVNNSLGIFVESNDNVLTRNLIVNSTESGVKIYASCNCAPVRGNIVTMNKLFNNNYGVQLINSNESLVYHNNFINNTHQASCSFGVNIWDNGYPWGGNFWSDYNGTDLYNGPEQNETGGDGIGDAPYTNHSLTEDNFPLMAPINLFDASTWNGVPYSVDVISNSYVSDFHFNPDEGAFLRFNVTGQDGTVGFARVTIPKDLLWHEDGWTVCVGDDQVIPAVALDDEYTYLYFAYIHSIKTIEIRGTHVIPESPSAIILPLLMIATLLAVMIRRNRAN